jgi:caspase domain-containing protein
MRRGPAALAFLSTLAWMAEAEPVFAQRPSAERPTYEVGMRWLLNDGAYDLIRATSDVYFFAAGPNRQIQLTRDLGLYRVLKDGRVDWQIDPPPPIKWPLEVGKFGTLFNAILHSREYPSGLPVQLTWQVKAYESVQVPAGAYQAFRILYLAEYIGDPLKRSGAIAGRQSWSVDMWYAPEVKQIVKAEGAGLRGLDFQLVAADQSAQAALQVILDDPKDQVHTGSAETMVGGKVTAGAGVARVLATLNGAEILARAERSPPQEVALSFSVPLREGKNVLLVTVTDTKGQTKQEARVIFRDRSTGPPVATGPRPPSPAPAPVTPAPPPVTPAPKPAPASPLQVAISSPRDQARVDQESIALAGLASSGKGVRRVLVTLNGVEVSRLEERAPLQTMPVNLPLKLKDGQNTIVVTATDADGATQQDVRAVFFDRAVPFTVQFRHPENGARLSDQSSLVAAEVSSGKGVATVNVLLNGAEVFKEVERPPKRSLAVAAPVKLREGTNTIVVRATEPDGTVRQEIRTVIYERPSPVQPTVAAAAVPKPSREQWAVVIGVGHYSNAAIPQLHYTVADAELVQQVLVGQGGFKKDNVLLITDKTERKPTLRDLKWALGTFLARSAKKDDLIVIFFAGHGAPEVDPRGAESDGLAKYLVPSDADPNDLYSTALPMDEFQTIFDRIEAERVVVFVDACYSGAAGGRTFASKRTRATRVDEVFLDRLTRSKGRAILTASRGSEVSLEVPELGHGLFTHYLVQGLRGAADLDRDGIVSLQELYQYLEQQVSQKSRSIGGNQHPVMKGELEGLMPLIKVGGK